jgi:hypothetical protein
MYFSNIFFLIKKPMDTHPKEKRTISLAQIEMLKAKRQKLLKKRRQAKQKKYDKYVLEIPENEKWTIAEKKQVRIKAAQKKGVSPTPPKGWKL